MITAGGALRLAALRPHCSSGVQLFHSSVYLVFTIEQYCGKTAEVDGHAFASAGRPGGKWPKNSAEGSAEGSADDSSPTRQRRRQRRRQRPTTAAEDSAEGPAPGSPRRAERSGRSRCRWCARAGPSGHPPRLFSSKALIVPPSTGAVRWPRFVVFGRYRAGQGCFALLMCTGN